MAVRRPSPAIAVPRADVATASIDDVLRDLGTDRQTGLSEAEVLARLQRHGYNEVPPPGRHPVVAFLGKFWGLSAWMLELIIVLSVILGKYADVAVVAGLLVVNAVLGFVQEQRAAGVVESLRHRLQVRARALRDGTWRVVPARELVPGDIVRLRSGDIVPADVKVVSGRVAVDQSALTGESVEVEKSPGEVVPSGSLARRGEAGGVVVLTGAATAFGRVAQLVQLARPALHVDEVVGSLVRWLFVIVGLLQAAVAALSIVRGVPMLEMLPLMLVLLTSAVPVALPVMFTVGMAVGARELARRGVLVTRLSASEDAATMDVVCVDKTGTITRNSVVVTGVIPLGDASEGDVLSAGAQASQEANLDPIDLAFLAAARERHALDAGAATVSFSPFDPQTRRTEATVEQGGRRYRVTKGAVRAVAEACGMATPQVESLEAKANEAALKGYRTLAVARGSADETPRLLGLVTLLDPPRPDAASLIAAIRGLGVGVKMLTGDALPVATEVGRMVGLATVRRASDLRASGPGWETEALAGADGLAEVYPEDKYEVVRQLQAAGHVVGMTGDGINDAPALRQAEVGIAVSTATDVAKGAASVVLTEPGLTSIVQLIEQGRAIHQRILTWVVNKISRTILKAGFVAVAFAVTGRFVVSAFAMLLLVFLTDFAKVALATDRVRPSTRPATWNIAGYVVVAVILGVAMVAEALLLLWLVWTPFGLGRGTGALHTACFQTLIYFGVFSIVSTRERRWFWSSRPSTPLALALVADAVAGTLLSSVGLPDLPPLPWWQTLCLFAYAMAACLILNDTMKVLALRRLCRAD
jgi:plasma-membrane proton-efflux P-type ATPase